MPASRYASSSFSPPERKSPSKGPLVVVVLSVQSEESIDARSTDPELSRNAEAPMPSAIRRLISDVFALAVGFRPLYFPAVLALPIEPDTDSPAGPELPAPRMDRPDFQRDDQTGAVVIPERRVLIQVLLLGPTS
jgi:hypothetical protein